FKSKVQSPKSKVHDPRWGAESQRGKNTEGRREITMTNALKRESLELLQRGTTVSHIADGK
ncbi:MAG TPA: hypothetical protein VL361_07250, partial [Candidatus Limnocylindrales bacterium]|nr:hypothetical protein [Candidatus Limnocylindrales bacterium]